jgi:diguanylate cyclase (GGDEF)-like protein
LFGNNRKTIGVFISHVNDHFQDAFSRGIITKARELDYNVAFFCSFGGYGLKFYETGEFYMTEVPCYEELDGIIVTPDVMDINNLFTQYKNKIRNQSRCPVVSIRREIDEYYNVVVDNNIIMDDIIRHFIEVHGFNRINYLSGPVGTPDSDGRLNSYKRILTEYNIPVDEKRIYYGNFWKNCGNAAVEYWLNNMDEMPQAVICANDYMAFSVCKALAERGIKVPGQIAVSGCDDINDASEFNPSLTTVKIPYFDMGMEAVVKIDKHNKGIEQPRNSIMDTYTVYRASCGCRNNLTKEKTENQRNHIIERDELQDEIIYNAFMSADLTGLSTADQLFDTAWRYIYLNKNVSRFFMCLFNNWDYYHDDKDEECQDDNDEIMMEIGMKDQERYTKIKFPRKELIPPVLSEDKPAFYYISMLHHQSHCFGYVGISFSKIQTYMKSFQAWLINLSNALENIRIHEELNRLVYKLEDMSIRDDLTDIYNRRVIDTLGKKYLKHCLDEQTGLMVFTVDMDKLKYINDNFGHSYGDCAIKAVASSLQNAADDDEICIRLGGDEFMAIGIDYDEDKLNKFIDKFISEINKFNLLNQHEFCIYVSYGYKLTVPDADTTIEEFLIEADTLMYQQKKEKESRNIKNNWVG